jgi:chromosome partitioning protein
MLAVVGGIKGGAGKTIMATNLAVLRAAAGRQVLRVDGDDQESATLWSATRNEVLGEKNRITTIQLTGRGTRDELQRLAGKYDDIIIDVGGRDTTTQRAALTVADLLLLPFPRRGPDIWTADKVAQMVKEVRGVNHGLRAVAFLNRADRGGSDNRAAADLLAQAEGIDLLNLRVGDRKAFPNAFTTGLGVAELKRPNPKAVAEIEGLYQALFETVLV